MPAQWYDYYVKQSKEITRSCTSLSVKCSPRQYASVSSWCVKLPDNMQDLLMYNQGLPLLSISPRKRTRSLLLYKFKKQSIANTECKGR